MNNFVYQNPTQLIFGKNTESTVGAEVSKYGKKVLLHYVGGSIKSTGLYDRIVSSLNESSVDFIELSGVQPNPRVSLVREGVTLCKEHNVDFILAVGGGSVIDSAKAIALGATNEDDVWNLIRGSEIKNNCLPLGVILTIPAAGSESSSGSVITNEEGLYKRAIGHGSMRPKFAILNPELTYTLPMSQTLNGLSDMLAHVMERYFVTTKNVELTDRLCEATMKTIINNARKVLVSPNNYDVRAEIMISGTVAHNNWLDIGRGGDWASHDIEHELSGIYDIAHGAGLSIIFPAWMKYVYKTDINRFVQFANRVWDIEIDINDLEGTALKGINALETFFKEIGLPTRLSDVDIDGSRLEEMAKKSNEDGPRGSFVKLYEKDVLSIFRLAL